MKIREIQMLLDAELLCGEDNLDGEVFSACCSDMMSDVLAYVKDQGVLLTGLVNAQTIRTASMMDMVCVVFVRDKAPDEEMIRLARECGIVLMRSKMRAYEAAGQLYLAGLRGNAGGSHG
ncbi:MAG: hypothetical protein MJ088_02635 [Clostridia bacterium]|nr:hypothetical protein [Clostridia bacterium]